MNEWSKTSDRLAVLWFTCACCLLVLILTLVGCAPVARADTLSSPAAVKSAIEAAVAQASVTATTYPAQLASLGINGQQAAVIRYSTAQAYLVASAQLNGGVIPQSARDYVMANGAKLLQVGVPAADMVAVNAAASSATTVGAQVWVDMRGLDGKFGVGTSGSAPTTFTYPTVTSNVTLTAFPQSRRNVLATYGPLFYSPSSYQTKTPSTVGITGDMLTCLSWVFAVVVGNDSHGSPLPVSWTSPYFKVNGTNVASVDGNNYFQTTGLTAAAATNLVALAANVPREGSNGTSGTVSSFEATAGGALFAEFLNTPLGIWDLNSGLYSTTEPYDPNDPALYPGAGTLAPGNPSIWQKAQEGPLFGSGYGIDNSYTGPSAGMKQAADDLEGAIANMGDWGAFNWVKEILYWLVAPFTTLLRGVASVVDFFAGLLDQATVWLSTLFVPTDQQWTLGMGPMVDTYWTYMRATPMGKIGTLVNVIGHSLAENASTVTLNLVWPFAGFNVNIPFETWLDYLAPYRSMLVAGVYLVFGAEIAGWFKPKVQ